MSARVKGTHKLLYRATYTFNVYHGAKVVGTRTAEIELWGDLDEVCASRARAAMYNDGHTSALMGGKLVWKSGPVSTFDADGKPVGGVTELLERARATSPYSPGTYAERKLVDK